LITIRGLSKRYGSKLALDNLDLDVSEGELFCFLGPNGAGKTTTIKLLTGLLHPTAGSVSICGIDIQTHPTAAKQVIGYIPDTPFLYEKLTGREFLSFVASLYNQTDGVVDKKMADLVDLFGIEDIIDQLIDGYSHGMRQKLCFCAALIHNPRVIIVDEPWVGLDPKSIKLVKKHLREKTREGMTVFMSTHTLSIAEEISDRIAIINEGKLVAMGTVDEIKSRSHNEQFEDVFLDLTAET